MSKSIQAVRGMNDILPLQTPHWRFLENKLQQLARSYGYQEIRLPIVERTELFKRTIGEVTDIVEKEMYTFADLNNDSLSLRPEGTAGCVRAGIEHGLFYNQQQRLWYMGPIFRHERPQKGRYRQFHQFGVEAFGAAGPDIDAELICMGARLWRQLNLQDHIELQINTLGNQEVRKNYLEKLVNYLHHHFEQLDEDSKRRLTTNPLRILDSKNPEMRQLLDEAPSMQDCLDEESASHFQELRHLLDKAGIKYTINPKLVRGLDYYSHTVFEWVTDKLGSQGTVCAGGRYDNLVEQLGGPSTPAIGFAVGIERVIALIEDLNLLPDHSSPVHAYLIMVGANSQAYGFALAEKIRNSLPKLNLICNIGEGSFKSQFKKADKSGALLALIAGEEEVNKQQIAIKLLREDKPQLTLAIDNLRDFLSNYLI